MMAARDGWFRYERTLDGAWHAIDDLRDAVREIRDEDRVKLSVFQRNVALLGVVGILFSVSVAVHTLFP